MLGEKRHRRGEIADGTPEACHYSPGFVVPFLRLACGDYVEIFRIQLRACFTPLVQMVPPFFSQDGEEELADGQILENRSNGGPFWIRTRDPSLIRTVL